ncbi:uncharacterized protein ACBT44_005359 isoform 1-T1 [Syngnathus typhle]
MSDHPRAQRAVAAVQPPSSRRTMQQPSRMFFCASTKQQVSPPPDKPAWSSFQLNTPPPRMSTSSAPRNQPDPFLRGPHVFRVLGGPTLTPRSDSHPCRMILQLSAEEDLAVTCLLKLSYPEDSQVGRGDDTATPPSGAPWMEPSRPDDVEHYEEYLLPIPAPPLSTQEEHG